MRVVVNGRPREMAPDTAVGAVVAELGVSPLAPGAAVAVNDQVVPRGAWATHRLRDGDRVEVLTAVQGG